LGRKLVLIVVFLLLLVCLVYPRLQQNRVNASAGYPVHNVNTGLNYASIQEAIDANETLDGHTIHVDAGTYYVNNTVDNVINKALSLVGDGKENTTIIATSPVSIFYVTSDHVTISGFTMRNGTCGVEAYSDYVHIMNCTISGNDEGISIHYLYLSDRLFVGEIIEGNILMNNTMAMQLETCNSTICRNFVSDNGGGIYLSPSAQGLSLPNGNLVYENTIINSSHVPYIATLSVGGYNNSIFLNNFLGKNLVRVNPGSANTWNCSFTPDNLLWGGNFWSDYNQTNEYGLGDVPFMIDANNTDYHPLTGTLNIFDVHYGYEVDIISNSTISNFEFNLINQSNAALSFIVGGESGTQGFCRVIMPEPLITSNTATVELDGKAAGHDFVSNLTHWMTFLWYSHSFHQIEIAGVTTVPEFPTFLIPSLLMMATLLAIIVYKKKHLI